MSSIRPLNRSYTFVSYEDEKPLPIKFLTSEEVKEIFSKCLPYTPEPETYLRSSVPNESTERAYVWVANELYEFLLVNPSITKTIYESKDRSAYLSLVEFFVKRLPNDRYDSDFFHDWTLNGENNGFMRQIRSVYNEYTAKGFYATR